MYRSVLIAVCTFILVTHARTDTYEDVLLEEILNEIDNGNYNEKDWLAEDDYSNIPYQENYYDIQDTHPDFLGNTLDNDMNDVTTDSVDKSIGTSSDVPIAAEPRDNEYEPQNAKWGYQYISGGAGEVDADGHVKEAQEVKTDAGLPSYCNPPNPCPKGKTSATDNCQDNVPDNGDFNQRYVQWQMKRGDCGCDTEHMFPASCPKGAEKISSHPEEPAPSISEMDSLISDILGTDTRSENPFVAQGEKRATLVAKKGSYHRTKRSVNPYLDGDNIQTVAKKAPPMMAHEDHNYNVNMMSPAAFAEMEKMFGSH